MDLSGTYGGIVESVKDPEKRGRIKVRVPAVYGVLGSGSGFVATDSIPWALPAGIPSGGSGNSGGFSLLPIPGDHVWVRFLDGEPEKPIWEWGVQTVGEAENFKLHQYDDTIGTPNRTGWTRYGHTIELNDSSVLATTSQGYRLSLIDGEAAAPTGLIQLTSRGGNQVEIDDETNTITLQSNEDLQINVGDEIYAISRSITLDVVEEVTANVGTDLDLTVGGSVTGDVVGNVDLTVGGNTSATVTGNLTANVTGNAQLQAALIQLQEGSEPFVKGTQLVTFLTSLLTYLTSHTHGNGNAGSPTTPPLIPPTGVVQPEPSTLISTTIFGS